MYIPATTSRAACSALSSRPHLGADENRRPTTVHTGEHAAPQLTHQPRRREADTRDRWHGPTERVERVCAPRAARPQVGCRAFAAQEILMLLGSVSRDVCGSRARCSFYGAVASTVSEEHEHRHHCHIEYNTHLKECAHEDEELRRTRVAFKATCRGSRIGNVVAVHCSAHQPFRITVSDDRNAPASRTQSPG